MRTTVTLEPDAHALIERAMRERGVSFKQALNDAVRAGMAPRSPRPLSTRTFAMGAKAGADLDKALTLADRLEDEEIVRDSRVGR